MWDLSYTAHSKAAKKKVTLYGLFNWSTLVTDEDIKMSEIETENFKICITVFFDVMLGISLICSSMSINPHRSGIMMTIGIFLLIIKYIILKSSNDKIKFITCERCHKNHVTMDSQFTNWICWDCVTEEDYKSNNVGTKHDLCSNNRCVINHCRHHPHQFKLGELPGKQTQDADRFCSGVKCRAFLVEKTTE